MKHRDEQDNWAEQVPSRRFRSPYRDYGWERGQSALPEFRDPSIDFMPSERGELGPWQGTYGRRIVGEQDLPGGGPQGRYQPGPHAGKGPRGYTRTDERIYDEVCSRMTQHGDLDARGIGVEVSGGEITLTGRVPDRQSKRLAQDIADSVYGVQDVHNRVQVQQTQQTPPRWKDRVGRSGVYPASEADQAPPDAQAQGEASWGQGERGAAGYNDHGQSEIHPEQTRQKKA